MGAVIAMTVSAGTVDINDEAQVSPGLLGFIATFALAVIVGFLFIALRRSLRRVDHGAGQLPGVTALPLATFDAGALSGAVLAGAAPVVSTDGATLESGAAPVAGAAPVVDPALVVEPALVTGPTTDGTAGSAGETSESPAVGVDSP